MKMRYGMVIDVTEKQIAAAFGFQGGMKQAHLKTKGYFMRTKYDALQIANEIILTAKENHQNITNLQLQKILYYIQGNFMRVFGYKAFNEKILCWDYGPVVEDVWHKYNIYGRSPLSPDNNEHICSKQEINLITDVVSEKLALNIWKMVDDTHNEYPWKNANDNNRTVISDEDMEKQFC